jgi:hypothetical protein
MGLFVSQGVQEANTNRPHLLQRMIKEKVQKSVKAAVILFRQLVIGGLFLPPLRHFSGFLRDITNNIAHLAALCI